MHTLGCTLKLEISLDEKDFILQYDRFINLENSRTTSFGRWNKGMAFVSFRSLLVAYLKI